MPQLPVVFFTYLSVEAAIIKDLRDEMLDYMKK